MYAAIRQGKAKAGQAEELARRIKEGAIPIISDVEGFMGYYVVYAPDDTVIAISLFNNYAAAEESNKRALAWIENGSRAAAHRAGNGDGRAGDRAYAGLRHGPETLMPVFHATNAKRLRGDHALQQHGRKADCAAKICTSCSS